MTTTFRLGDILSITTGRLVSRDHMDGVYRILNHMTGDDLMTHQIPRAMDECRPYLVNQHPTLASIHIPRCEDADTLWAWLSDMEVEHGDNFNVEPVPHEAHTPIDPIAELKMTRPNTPIITIETES